jgi:hypothetical protein
MHVRSITFFLTLSFSIVSALPESKSNPFGSIPAMACDLPSLESIIYTNSLTEFLNLFHSDARPSCFEWCTNACSLSPDSFNFGIVDWQPACARHDFSWRNLKKLGAFDDENKLKADNQLRDGMIELCGTHQACIKEVAIYYKAVRLVQTNTANHNHWNAEAGTRNIDCTVFPGCCLNHSDPKKCGVQSLPGRYIGDGSCVAK